MFTQDSYKRRQRCPKQCSNQTPAQHKQLQRFVKKQYQSLFDPTIESYFDQWLGQSSQRVPCLVCEQQSVPRVLVCSDRRNHYARV